MTVRKSSKRDDKMAHTANRQKFVALAITTALAGVTLGGCTTHAAPRADASASKAQTALAKGQSQQALSHAEAAVLAEPRDAGYRAMLGGAYMEMGRFDAAATSFGDAMELGDTSPRTALSYALAKIAQGDNPAALAVLEENRQSLSADDYGLALALAGQADRGASVLGSSLRAGNNTAKLRQNLAYAYALQGNWRAARVMAAEDVPANQVDERMGEWAQLAKAGEHHQRVAALLQVPVVADPGQPAALALNIFPGHDAMVAQAAANAPSAGAELPPMAVATQAAAPTSASLELPLLKDLPAVIAAQPEAAPVAAAKPLPPSFAAAFNAPAEAPKTPQAALAPAALPTGNTFSEIAGSAVRFISKPVVQTLPSGETAKAPAPAPRRTARAAVVPRIAGQAERQTRAAAPQAKPAAMATDGDHLIQLGSYASKAQAEAGWKTLSGRYPQLRDFQMVITEAEVRGKKYFRVSAGGFERTDARSMCSTMKKRGQGCIAWADGKPLPGALKRTERLARR